MLDEQDHAGHVDLWIERSARGLPPDLLLGLFERALHALWRRACLPLGDVTLTAIIERVFHTASERFPLLSALSVDAAGISCAELYQSAGALRETDFLQAMRFVLVELLTVLGNLTAEILSPALHAVLASVTQDDTARSEHATQTPHKRTAIMGGEGIR